MIENYTILCFGSADWDNPYRTNQHHIMERLAQKNTVLYIESPGLRTPAIQKKDLLRIVRRLYKTLIGVRKIHERLMVYSPLVIPLHRFAIVRWFNAVFLRWQLDRVVRRLNVSSVVLWIYAPTGVSFMGRWKEQLTVYHCVDELAANPRIPTAVREIEKELLRRADIVFVTSKALFETKSPFNQNTYYMPNVADYDHFHTACDSALDIPADLARIPSPRIGHIGAVSAYKLDFDLIEQLARRHPEWSLVFIGAFGEGEKGADITGLKKYTNIHFLGGRPYSELPGYMKGLDVCLLPNRLNEYTKAMFPMKFFEYLSAGKPVVATNLYALQEFSAWCTLAKSADEYEQGVIRALAEGEQPIIIQQRLSGAQRYTWVTRIEEMSTHINTMLTQKEGAHARK